MVDVFIVGKKQITFGTSARHIKNFCEKGLAGEFLCDYTGVEMVNKDCIFCKIIKGEIPSKKELETDDFIVIWDIKPQASTHLLLIPREHVQDLRFMNNDLWLKIKEIVQQIAKEKKLSSFRLVHNAGEAAVVKHAHVHFLGEVPVDRKL